MLDEYFQKTSDQMEEVIQNQFSKTALLSENENKIKI